MTRSSVIVVEVEVVGGVNTHRLCRQETSFVFLLPKTVLMIIIRHDFLAQWKLAVLSSLVTSNDEAKETFSKDLGKKQLQWLHFKGSLVRVNFLWFPAFIRQTLRLDEGHSFVVAERLAKRRWETRSWSSWSLSAWKLKKMRYNVKS